MEAVNQYLDKETHRTLERLALVGHKSVEKVVAELVQVEALRTWPQQYEITQKPRPAMPWDSLPEDPEMDRKLMEGLRAADERAKVRYAAK